MNIFFVLCLLLFYAPAGGHAHLLLAHPTDSGCKVTAFFAHMQIKLHKKKRDTLFRRCLNVRRMRLELTRNLGRNLIFLPDYQSVSWQFQISFYVRMVWTDSVSIPFHPNATAEVQQIFNMCKF